MTTVKDFVIDGRKGTYAQLDNGLFKFVFDDGEVRIARKNCSITEDQDDHATVIKMRLKEVE